MNNHIKDYYGYFSKCLSKHVVWSDAGRQNFLLLVALIELTIFVSFAGIPIKVKIA